MTPQKNINDKGFNGRYKKKTKTEGISTRFELTENEK